MTLGSRGSGLDRFSTQRRLVPRVTYFYLRSVGARTYSPSIRSRIRRFLSGKGSKKGLLRATRIREFRLSVIGGGSPVGGGKHGHLKCRLGNERGREREKVKYRTRTYKRKRVGQWWLVFYRCQLPFSFSLSAGRPPCDASTEIKSPPSFNQSTNLLIPDLLASYAPSRT